MILAPKKVSQTNIFQRKIGFLTKTAFLITFLAPRITNFSESQLDEKKKEIVQNLRDKSRIYEISLEFIFVTFAPEKVSQSDIFPGKIGFLTKTAFLSAFLTRITNFSGSQLGENKRKLPKIFGKNLEFMK